MHQRLAIHGKARAGKDTIATYLTTHHGFLRNGFADPLKRAAQQMFMLTDAQTWSDELKEVVIPYWGMSPREMFQKLGTEGGRNVFGEDLWPKRWKLHFDTYSPVSAYVTPDVRFENEAEFLRKLGFTIIHVTRPGGTVLDARAQKHASEMGVTFDPFCDWRVYNDGTIRQLEEQVNDVVKTLKERGQ